MKTPPWKNTVMNPGVTQGIEIVGLKDIGKIPIKAQATNPEAAGEKTIGITYKGFNIIGKPKMIGSLILKILAGITSLRIALYFSDFANRVAIHNPNVFPAPPI